MDRGFVAVVKRELRQLWQRKSFLIGMTTLPVFCLIFFLTLFGSSELHNFPIAVVDKDNSTMSRKFARMIDATAGIKIEYMPQSLKEAQELMFENKINAVLYIPKDMEKDIYTANTVKPLLYLNSVRLLNSSLVYKDVAMTAQMFSAGIEMQLLTTLGETPLQSQQLAMPIYYEKHLMFNPYASYGYYLETPFNVLLILLFAILSTVFSVGMEQKNSTTKKWLDCAKDSPYIAITGKAIVYTIYYSLFAVISDFIIYGYMETPIVGSIWLMSLNTILSIIAYQSMGLIILFVIKKMMVAMSISAALTTMSFTMGGLTFPLIAMYKPIFYLAHLFPYTYFIYAYVDITRGASALYSLPYISILLIYPIIAILLAPQITKLMLKSTKEELI